MCLLVLGLGQCHIAETPLLQVGDALCDSYCCSIWWDSQLCWFFIHLIPQPYIDGGVGSLFLDWEPKDDTVYSDSVVGVKSW